MKQLESKSEGEYLTFLGDIYLPRPFRAQIKLENYIPNLEYSITSSMEGYPGKINLKAEGLYLEETFGSNPIAVCLANNHVLDYGNKGFIDTLTHLDNAGVRYWGAGITQKKLEQPLILDIDNTRVALLAYACATTHPVAAGPDFPGVEILNPEHMYDQIRNLRAGDADRIVVIIHWGAQEVYLPKPTDTKIARSAIDAGADLIIGHHAHLSQPIEVYKNHHIFYGLGNCIMPDLDVDAFFDPAEKVFRGNFVQQQNYWNRRSLAVRYSVQKNSAEVVWLVLKKDTLVSRGEFQKPTKMHGLMKLDHADYEKRFNRSYYWGKLRPVVFKYLKNPRMIAPKQIRAVLDLLQNSSKES